MSPFSNFVKFAVTIECSDGKKKVGNFPKNWTKLTNSLYNNEPNFAVLTGSVNNIVVIDIDNYKSGFNSVEWFEQHFGPVSQLKTLTTKTINDGYHVYFKYHHELKSTNIKDKNIDIKSDGGCVFEGIGYTLIHDCDIQELTSAQIKALKSLLPNSNQLTSSKSDTLNEILQTIDISNTYDTWRDIGFSVIDYCKSENIPLDQGLQSFKMYSQRNDQKYDEKHTEEQWNSWINNNYNGNKITKGTLLKLFKDAKTPKDTTILHELDTLSGNSEVKIHEIKHLEIYKKSKASIEAFMQSQGLDTVHNYVSKNCKGIDLYSECDRNGYKICCRNCDFAYPPHSIPVDKALAPTVFNMVVVNKDENISNKDTSQVARKILTYTRILYTTDNKWYQYNEESGIYQNKNDLEIMTEMENVIEEMERDGQEQEWFNWIHKVNYKESLLKEMKIKSFKRVKLDNDDFILGFENGVLDLKTGEFRKGKYNEYVTMKCGVPFDTDVDTTLATSVLNGIFPNEQERDYALNRFALCLEGYNREQMITFNYGYTASNGKSYLMERLGEALGDYGGTFPVTLLTGKMKTAGEANSCLVDFDRKRFMYCSEPEAGVKLNTNFVKVLTGDKIKARGLYADKEKEIRPTYKVFVCCNTLPNFDVYDEGIARRIRLMEYRTRFCEHPKKKNEKQLQKYTVEEDELISRGLLKLLVDRYNALRQCQFKYEEPQTFVSLRRLYLNDNKDVITDLLHEHFEEGGQNDYVKLTDIKNVLKTGGIKEKDIITIQKIVEETFEKVDYKENSSVNNRSMRRFFLRLKSK